MTEKKFDKQTDGTAKESRSFFEQAIASGIDPQRALIETDGDQHPAVIRKQPIDRFRRLFDYTTTDLNLYSERKTR